MDKSRRFYNHVGSTYAEIYVKFATFYGDIALHFPLFHSLTGCDTRSYYHYHGKTIPWNCNIKSGFKLTYRDSGNTIHFSWHSFCHLARKSRYQNIIYIKKEKEFFPIQRNETYFAATIRNDFNKNVSCFMRKVLLSLHVQQSCEE